MEKIVRYSEIFESFQGEAQPLGERVLFIRLSGCNLNCSFCDTKEKINIINEIDIDQLCDQISFYSTVVITGGEPLLQVDTITYLAILRPNITFYIETNGVLNPRGLIQLKNVNFNISPKPDAKYHIHPKFKNVEAKRKIYKFVIDPDEKVFLVNTELQDVIQQLPKRSIYFMPLTTSLDKQMLLEEHASVAKIARKYKVNFSPRLHILFDFQ